MLLLLLLSFPTLPSLGVSKALGGRRVHIPNRAQPVKLSLVSRPLSDWSWVGRELVRPEGRSLRMRTRACAFIAVHGVGPVSTVTRARVNVEPRPLSAV